MDFFRRLCHSEQAQPATRILLENQFNWNVPCTPGYTDYDIKNVACIII